MVTRESGNKTTVYIVTSVITNLQWPWALALPLLSDVSFRQLEIS